MIPNAILKHLRRDGPRPSRLSGTSTPLAKRLRTAVAEPSFPEETEQAISRIEEIRAELSGRDDVIHWDRPWLAKSEELLARLDVAAREDMTAAITVAKANEASRPPADCRALLALSREVRPASALELGTNLGISGSYIATGLAPGGRLHTFEGSVPKCGIARDVFARLDLPVDVVPGDFFDTLQPALDGMEGLDLAFIDGFHEGDATVRFHEMCKAKARPGAVLVYDDIRWSDGMVRAWNRITADGDVAWSFEFGAMGVCGLC